MKQTLHMFVALAGIALASGLALGGLHQATAQRAADNILRFKKVPAVVSIAQGPGGALSPDQRSALEDQLLRGRRQLDLGAENPLSLFIIEQAGQAKVVNFEAFGQGFGGDLGVMVGFDLASGKLAGIGITTMSETPGLGTRVRETTFTRQFVGLGPEAAFQVKKDGGVIDGVTGATVSSRAVAQAVDRARKLFQAHRQAIVEAASHGRPEASP